MPKRRITRKDRLRAACVQAGTTLEGFATHEGVTLGHLYMVLSGQRESARLSTAVDAFIAEHLPQRASAA